MQKLPIHELYSTRKLKQVDKAYYSLDFKTVIVELQNEGTYKLGGPQKLYFDYEGFRVEQVQRAIMRLMIC